MTITGAVLDERDGHLALLILNRPDVLNAVNTALSGELSGHLEHAVANARQLGLADHVGEPCQAVARTLELGVRIAANAAEGAAALAQKRAPVWTGR